MFQRLLAHEEAALEFSLQFSECCLCYNSSVLLWCLLAYIAFPLYKIVFWQLAVLGFLSWYVCIYMCVCRYGYIFLSENCHQIKKEKKRKHAHHYHCAWETGYVRPVLDLREKINWILMQLNSTFLKIKMTLCKCTSEIHPGKITGTRIQ